MAPFRGVPRRVRGGRVSEGLVVVARFVDPDFAGADLPGYDFLGFEERDLLDAARDEAFAVLREAEGF